MSATASSSAEARSSTSAGLAGVDPAGRSVPAAGTPSADGSLPVVGKRWREKYDILEALTAPGAVQQWRGRVVDGGDEVVLRAFQPAELEVRAQAWSKLGGIDSPHLQHARDAQKVGEWRVEVAAAPVGVPLHVWRAGRASVDATQLKTIVSHIAEALAALHAFELVHLGLRSDGIKIVEDGGTLTCVLEGLDALTSFDRKGAVPAAVDPRYAPPESAGLTAHVAGPGLCAWDWWSLGRVVQELVLGRPIASHLAPGAGEPEQRALAEALLLEADPKGPRAGAVEKMPSMDANWQLLLRGLLTTAQEARWTGDNVDRWIRGLPVKEHYDTPRKETHLRWRGRPYSVQELATTLQAAPHWAETSVQLYEPSTPGTLAHFLRWTPNQPAANEQLVTALELGDSLPLKLSTPAARREATTMVALLQLSAGKLVWRGRAFEPATIGVMMEELGEADAMMVLRGLSTRSTALQIERVDAAAGRLLTELGRTVGDVEAALKRHGWLNPSDTVAVARLFRLALEPVPTLRAAREGLAKVFAGSDHPAMQKLFSAQNVSRAELVVLAWAAANPAPFKFYTHAEAARRRAEALRTRGLELTAALTWAQLERALQVGRIVFGGWGLLIGSWFLIGCLALLVWPGPIGAVLVPVPGLLALVYRMVWSGRNRRALQGYVPDARWTWRDGPERCRRELRLAGHGVRREILETELQTITQELANLTQVQPKPEPLPSLPRFGGVRLAGALSWLLVLGCLGAGGWRLYMHPFSAKALKTAWAPAKEPAAPVKPVVTTAAAARPEEKETDVKVSWPYKAGDNAVKVGVRLSREATPEQIAYATQHGRELVAPYRPDTIGTPIILPVPGDDAAVMLFDGKRGELANQQVYLLNFRPIPRTWVEVGGRRGVYLDQ